MEKFQQPDQQKKYDNIPDEERVDLASSPVSKEEMAAALKDMQEAVVESEPVAESVENKDQERIRELQEQLGLIQSDEDVGDKGEAPPRGPYDHDGNGDDGEGGDGGGEGGHGNGDLEPIISREMSYKSKRCEACGGSGKKWFILNCQVCRGKGTVPAHDPIWKERIIGWKEKETHASK